MDSHSDNITQETQMNTCWYDMNEALNQYYKYCNQKLGNKFLNFVSTNEFENCIITDIIGNESNDMKWDILYFDDNFPIPNHIQFDHIKQQIDFITHIFNYCYNNKRTPKMKQIQIISDQIISRDIEYTQLKQKETHLQTEIKSLINEEHKNNNRHNQIDTIKQEIINQELEIQQKIKQLKVKQIQLQAKKKQFENEQNQIHIKNKSLKQKKDELIMDKQSCLKIKQYKIKQYETNVKIRQNNILNERNEIRIKLHNQSNEVNEYNSDIQNISVMDINVKNHCTNSYLGYLDNGMEELSFFGLSNDKNSIFNVLDLQNIQITNSIGCGDDNSNTHSDIEHKTNAANNKVKSSKLCKKSNKKHAKKWSIKRGNKKCKKNPKSTAVVETKSKSAKVKIQTMNVVYTYDKQWDLEANMWYNKAENECFELFNKDQFRMQLRDTENILRLYLEYRKTDKQRQKLQLNDEAFEHYTTIYEMEQAIVSKVISKQIECLSDMDKMYELYLDIRNKQIDIADTLLKLYNCRKKIEDNISNVDVEREKDIKLFEKYGFNNNIGDEYKTKKAHFRAYGNIIHVLIKDYETMNTDENAYIEVHLLITQCMEQLSATSPHTFTMIRKSENEYGRICEKKHSKQLAKLMKKKHGKQSKSVKRGNQKQKKKNNKKRKRK